MQFADGEDLHNVVLRAPIGICILNADTLVAEIVNEKFLEVAGKPYEAIFNQFYWDAFAEVRSYYEAALTRVIQSAEPYYADQVEMKLIRHGREEEIFVTFVYSPIQNETGKVSKVAVWVLENTKQVVERKKEEAAKIAFQRERDRFKNFFMQAPTGICILRGPELIYELVNPAYQQFLPGRELLDRSIFKALPELVGTPVEELLLSAYRNGEPYEVNEMLVPIAEYEGGPIHDRYFSFSYQPWRDENNHVEGLLVIAFDVSGMIEVQHELRDAREQAEQQKRVYETIMSGTPDLMYVWDLNYRFTYANSALLSMWGKTWDDAIGKGLRENGYEEWHAQMHEREIDHVIATKESVRGEVAFPHATLGRRIYDYILIPVLNENGEVEAVAGTTRDVTERKQWEEKLAHSSEELQAINEEMATSNEELLNSNEELRQTQELLQEETRQRQTAIDQLETSEQQMRSMVAAAPFPIGVYTGREMRILFANKTIIDIWGKGSDVIGKTYHETLPELAGQEIFQQLDRVFTTGEPFHAHAQRVDLVVDGRLQSFYFNYSFTPLFNSDGQVYGVMNTAAEVTDLVQAKQQVEQSEAELREIKKQLEAELEISKELEQQKDGFIGMASHELKTPLTSLSALLQVAKLKLKNSEDPFLANAMDKSNVQVRRMTEMINSFLNISRLESGKIHIEPQTFDLTNLIREMIAEASLTASAHLIHFIESPSIQISADRDKIGSVISNLISNAVKYSPNGKRIEIACNIEEDQAIVSVKDEGMGIMPADLEKIFDRYYRVQTGDTRYIAGFGIGLYLSSEIIERHGGKVWAESEPGVGSVFYFSLRI